MKCCACANLAFDNHTKAPLCAPCLDAWRELENSPRITAPYEVPEFSDEERRLKVDVVFREFDREVKQRGPDLARKIRQAIMGGDAGIERLGALLTPEEGIYGLTAILVALARTTAVHGQSGICGG